VGAELVNVNCPDIYFGEYDLYFCGIILRAHEDSKMLS